MQLYHDTHTTEYMSLVTPLNRIISTILSVLFPEYCVVCNKEDTSLCQQCGTLLSRYPHTKTIEPWIHVLFDYTDVRVRNVIYALKFKHTRSLAYILAPYMYSLYLEHLDQTLQIHESNIVLLPVPPLKAHIRKRGHDHIRHLAQAFATDQKHMTVLSLHCAERVQSRPQVGLSRKERFSNMKKGFRICIPSEIKNKTVYIIDDVVTTGATLRALRNALYEAGARDVQALVLAH